MKKAITMTLLLFLLLAGTGCSGEGGGVATPTAIPQPTEIPRPKFTVKRGTVTSELQFEGQMAPVSETPLYFPRDGKAGEYRVALYDWVNIGDVVAALDTSDLIREKTTLEEEIAAVEGNHSTERRKAELNVQICQLTLDLYRQQGRSALEIQIAELQLELAQLELAEIQDPPGLQAKRDRLAEIESLLANSELISTAEGYVLTIRITVGGFVRPTTVAITLGDPKALELRAILGEDKLRQLKEGMEVTITRADRKLLTGRIVALPKPFGESKDEKVHIQFDTPAVEAGYGINDLAIVLAVTEKREDVLWLPPQAIHSAVGRNFVVINEGGVTRRVDVKLGVVGTDRVEILQGVEEGQVVFGP